jgi:23S rRNA (cytosine1962-C5)-methyltransferase
LIFQHNIPAPSEKRIAVHVNPAAERALREGHPWLFEGAIQKQSHDGRPGDLAVVFDRKNRFLAVGLYDPDSPIRVRVLQANKPAKIDGDWFAVKLKRAADWRRPLLEDGRTNGCRLVHGENDGLPGLVVDRYGVSYVISLDTAAWVPYLPLLLPILKQLIGGERFVLRMSRSVERQKNHLYGLREGQVLEGAALEGPVEFMENGLRFTADLVNGQKTGFFLDQRENRARVETLVSKDRSVKRVLNLFAYTGGFSLYAARGGASHVTSVDLSHPAVETAEMNFELNQNITTVAQARHETMVGDAFEVLGLLEEAGKQYDMVVIDPPSFARRKGEEAGALGAYSRLVKLGLGVLRPNGTLVMSSCSSRIAADDFFDRVFHSAEQVGRPLSEIERSGHPLDHPVGFPEGAYLKCLFARA